MTMDLRRFKKSVLQYWRIGGRHDLPWRKTKDPYNILVSEVMLQQTQVPRVIPKYSEFLDRFPTVHDLARSPLSAVLKVWSGLGYNRRAKFLREAARIIVHTHAGTFPHSYEGMRALPGIGEYTAKAVRVFAFNKKEVLIETNIRAVFLHHFFPNKRNVSDKKLLPLIEESLKGQSSRMWYSALMDYGAHLKSTHPNPSRRSLHHTHQTRFDGSLRQMRGIILKSISKYPVTKAQIAGRCHLRRVDMERCEKALVSLERDELIKRVGSKWRIAT